MTVEDKATRPDVLTYNNYVFLQVSTAMDTEAKEFKGNI